MTIDAPPITRYAVNTLYQSIQGEGTLTGTPMIVLRLQGCGVGCPWCDTKQTWDLAETHRVDTLPDAVATLDAWCWSTPDQIVDTLRGSFPSYVGAWVLLTGGEPANQDLVPLVTHLHRAGYRVSLETSGTALGHLGAMIDWVTVSPKLDMPGGLAVLPDAVRSASEIKWVVGRQRDIDRLLVFLLEYRLIQVGHPVICLQPLSQSPAATRLCIDTCHRYGWRLSVQLHRYLDIP